MKGTIWIWICVNVKGRIRIQMKAMRIPKSNTDCIPSEGIEILRNLQKEGHQF
jgi:hypothetical protein